MKVKLPFPKPKANGVKNEETDVNWKVKTGPYLKQNKAKTIKITKNEDDVLATIAKCMGNVEEIIEQLEGQVKFLDFKVLTKEVYFLKENLKQVEQQTIANKNRETEKSEEINNLAELEKQTKKCYVKLEDISKLAESLTNKNDDDDVDMDDQTQEQDNDQNNDQDNDQDEDKNEVQSDAQTEVNDEDQVLDSDQDVQQQVQDEDLIIPSECSDYSDQEDEKTGEDD